MSSTYSSGAGMSGGQGYTGGPQAGTQAAQGGMGGQGMMGGGGQNTMDTSNTGSANIPASGPGSAGSQMDSLDKGVDGVLRKLGHGQNRQTTEKISDGIRSVFKKVTGRDVPIADKN